MKPRFLLSALVVVLLLAVIAGSSITGMFFFFEPKEKSFASNYEKNKELAKQIVVNAKDVFPKRTFSESSIEKWFEENRCHSIIKTLFPNENINFYINASGKTIKKSAITKNGCMDSFSNFHFSNPTINLYSDVKTIEDMIDKKETFKGALLSKKITYEGVGFWNSVRISAYGSIANIMSFLT